MQEARKERRVLKLIVAFGTLLFGGLMAFNALNLGNKIQIKMVVPAFFAVSWILLVRFLKFNISSRLGKVFYAYCITIFFSSIVRFDIKYVIAAVLAMMTFLLLRMSNLCCSELNYTIFCISALLVAISLTLRYGIVSLNSQGIVYAFVGIVWFNFLCLKKINSITIFAISSVLFVMLIAITKSRTSMMALILIIVISYVYLFLKKFTLRHFLVVLLTLGIMLTGSVELGEYFYKIFFGKWGNLDISSGRLLVWKTILSNGKLFGYGENCVEYLGFSGGIFDADAHNVFVQVYGCFGIISALIMIILTVYVIMFVWKSQNKIIYVNFFMGWFLVSMFENIEIFTSRFVIITILFFVHIVMLSLEEKKI